MAHILCPFVRLFVASVAPKKIPLSPNFPCCLFFILHFFVRISTTNQTIDTEKQLIFLTIEFFCVNVSFTLLFNKNSKKWGHRGLGKRYFRRSNRKTKEISCAIYCTWWKILFQFPMFSDLSWLDDWNVTFYDCFFIFFLFFHGRVQTDMNIPRNVYTSMSSLSMQYKM